MGLIKTSSDIRIKERWTAQEFEICVKSGDKIYKFLKRKKRHQIPLKKNYFLQDQK